MNMLKLFLVVLIVAAVLVGVVLILSLTNPYVSQTRAVFI